MLKPEQIRAEEFDLSVLGGYKREQVDVFLKELTADYEKLYNENSELLQKLKICVGKIEEYQKDEKFLKTAIINAEKLNENTLKEIEEKEKQLEKDIKEKAESIIHSANIEADEVVRSAKNEADSILNNAKSESEDIIKKAKREAAEAIAQCEIETAAKISEIQYAFTVEQEKYDSLKKEVSDFKENVLKLYKKHLDSLSKLPEFTAHEKNAKIEETVTNETDEKVIESEDGFLENVAPTADENMIKEPETPSTEIASASASETTKKDEQTAEFVIEKKEKETIDSSDIAKKIKFNDLKFGTDFDIKKDK